MAAITTSFSLDDYYDLTAEEEALLCQIDTQAATLAGSSGPTGGRVLSGDSQSHVIATNVAWCGSGDHQAGPWKGPAAISPPAADVLYPDRKCPVAIMKEGPEAASPTD